MEVYPAPSDHPMGKRTAQKDTIIDITSDSRGWSGGAMAVGKLPVPGRPTDLE